VVADDEEVGTQLLSDVQDRGGHLATALFQVGFDAKCLGPLRSCLQDVTGTDVEDDQFRTKLPGEPSSC
jgi:hypothetical protein